MEFRIVRIDSPRLEESVLGFFKLSHLQVYIAEVSPRDELTGLQLKRLLVDRSGFRERL